ncbi:MAG: hypothetical protein ACR2IP_12825 [Solirubrobacteraceae bacterium]
MSRPAQLSFMPMPRVLVRYDPDVQPPEATGPFEFGTFTASLAGHPGVRGEGKTEQAALGELATQLRDHTHRHGAKGRLTVLDQALTAAARLSEGDLITYLENRAEEPVLSRTSS